MQRYPARALPDSSAIVGRIRGSLTTPREYATQHTGYDGHACHRHQQTGDGRNRRSPAFAKQRVKNSNHQRRRQCLSRLLWWRGHHQQAR
jgi:hypothetical protein